MSITVVFEPTSGSTREQYEEIVRRLEDAGHGSPRGRLYHVTYGDAGEMGGFDVWSSRAEFEEFGKVLIPIVEEVGVELEEPRIYETYNIIGGSSRVLSTGSFSLSTPARGREG